MGKRVDFLVVLLLLQMLVSIKDLGVPIKIAKNITKPITVNKRNKTFLTKTC